MKRTVRKSIAILLILVFALSGILYADSTGIIESGQGVGPGTYYKNMVYDTPNGKFVINVLEAAIDTEYLKVETSDSGSKIVNKTVQKQALEKNSSDKIVIGAVNGDFFDMAIVKGLPYSTSIINGEIKTAVPSSDVFAVTSTGQCSIDKINMSGIVNYLGTSSTINAVNKLRWNNNLVVYTPSFGVVTKNTSIGTEVVVKGVTLPLKANTFYTGVIESVNVDTTVTTIPEDGIVLSGEGTTAAFLKTMMPGGTVTFSINIDKNDIKYAVSGFPRLINNGSVSADIILREDALKKHPRTAIAMKEGKLYMVTVDGRQPGISDGMTLYELTELLMGMGMENALNLDGGGSTTMVVRKQGKSQSVVANIPSEGSERLIGNSIQLVSYAPVSEPAIVGFSNNGEIKVYLKSSFKPNFFLMDKYYNLLPLDKTPVNYSTDKNTASVDKDGLFTAGKKAQNSYLDIIIGNAVGRLPVIIVDKVASLSLSDSYIHAEPGEKVQLGIKAYDENNKEIIISTEALNWAITGKVGKVDSKGLFVASKTKAVGKVSVKIGDILTEVETRIGKSPILAVEFENPKNLLTESIKGSAKVAATTKKEPVKTGKTGIKLEYKFDKSVEGTSFAYMKFATPVKVFGKPQEVGMWVYGDGSNHWIRGNYINAAGENRTVDFTKEGGLNWKGWKFVYTAIPQDEKFPIALEKVYIAEPLQSNKNSGKIFMDSFISTYKYETDIYSPEVVASMPAVGQSLSAPPDEIYFDVADKGTGVNTSTVKMYMGKTLLSTKKMTFKKINDTTTRITYKFTKKPKDKENTIILQLKDKAGNILNPEYKTMIKVN